MQSSFFNVISIRAPLAGSDPRSKAPRTRPAWDFNPRSPCGERPKGIQLTAHTMDFNPRSPCGERHGRTDGRPRVYVISIRAPLAGSDVLNSFLPNCCLKFQSALPLRGATYRNKQNAHDYRISIRAPLAGSDLRSPEGFLSDIISIRAPLAGSDAWGAGAAPCPKVISIRAPLAGSDRYIL